MDIFEYSTQNTERRIIENIGTIIHECFGKEIANLPGQLVSCRLPKIISQFKVDDSQCTAPLHSRDLR